eukprot:573238-Alexandrium_andersonii.AAC.1
MGNSTPVQMFMQLAAHTRGAATPWTRAAQLWGRSLLRAPITGATAARERHQLRGPGEGWPPWGSKG